MKNKETKQYTICFFILYIILFLIFYTFTTLTLENSIYMTTICEIVIIALTFTRNTPKYYYDDCKNSIKYFNPF